ncbi:hypothetical protein ACN6LM_003871 [Streptomyces sp. SAS_281]|uniref:hypothetical protein n=1 Tax=Streptomyces sp. SAS_281 TaxID=3412744 RepID=UPI00403D5313
MTTTHNTIAAAILGTVPGARPDLTRITVEHAYAPYGHSIRDTWSGSLAGLLHRIGTELQKTTPAGAEVTAARTTVLVALARALREQPTGARILQALDELGEAVVQGDVAEVRSWVEGISLLAGLPAGPDADLLVYRAEHDSIRVGLYTTAEAAQEHCEALVSREFAGRVSVFFEWQADEEDQEPAVLELDVLVDGERVSTGYTVTPLEAAASYDPDADE